MQRGVVSTDFERFPIPPQLPRPAEDLAAAKELLRPLLVTMPMPESSRRRERRVEAAEDEEAEGEVQPSC